MRMTRRIRGRKRTKVIRLGSRVAVRASFLALDLTPCRRQVAVVTDLHPQYYGLLARTARWFGAWYFRYELQGLDELPDGPCLVVANHSGLGIVEELLLLGAWEKAHGTNRRVRALVHDFFWRMPVVGAHYRAIGAASASHEAAHEAFERGDVVIVFPGGDLDCCRPFYEPRKVHFGERRGYIELAQNARVPIVPLATVGSHWTWTCLPGGRQLARLPGVGRALRTDCVPLPTAAFGLASVGALVALKVLAAWWIIPAAVAGLLPTPARVTSRVLPPMDVSKYEDVEMAHAAVHGELSSAVASRR